MPPEMRESVEAGLRMHAQRKEALIEALTKTGRCRFNKEQLKARTIDDLEAMAELANVPSYEGVGGTQVQPSANAAPQETGFAPTPPRVYERPKLVPQTNPATAA